MKLLGPIHAIFGPQDGLFPVPLPEVNTLWAVCIPPTNNLEAITGLCTRPGLPSRLAKFHIHVSLLAALCSRWVDIPSSIQWRTHPCFHPSCRADPQGSEGVCEQLRGQSVRRWLYLLLGVLSRESQSGTNESESGKEGQLHDCGL